MVSPAPYGAHNWQPMSYSPQTGLAYLPAQNVPINMVDDKDWKYNEVAPGRPHSGLGWNLAKFANVEPPKGKPMGRLIAPAEIVRVVDDSGGVAVAPFDGDLVAIGERCAHAATIRANA